MQNPNVWRARLVGVLFVVGTVAGILSAVFTLPVLNAPDYPTNVAAGEQQLVLGALLMLVMGFALSLIPAVMWPVFRQYNEALALGALLFRGALEATVYVAMALCLLMVIPLSRAAGPASQVDEATFLLLGTLLKDSVDWLNYILAIVFSMGAVMVYGLFYQSRLIPR